MGIIGALIKILEVNKINAKRVEGQGLTGKFPIEDDKRKWFGVAKMDSLITSLPWISTEYQAWGCERGTQRQTP